MLPIKPLESYELKIMGRENVRKFAQFIQSLSREEKQLLELELQPNAYFREHLGGNISLSAPIILLELKEWHCRLIRLTDSQYIALRQNSISCKSNFLSFWEEYRFNQKQKNLSLGEIYVTLTDLSGESGQYFDSYKGTFCFPFFLEVIRNGRTYYYLVKFQDYKGALEIEFYYCLENREDKKDNKQDEGLSLEERWYFKHFLQGYLIGYLESKEDLKHSEFIHFIDSSLIIYGYRNGGFFEQQYETLEEYQESLKEF